MTYATSTLNVHRQGFHLAGRPFSLRHHAVEDLNQSLTLKKGPTEGLAARTDFSSLNLNFPPHFRPEEKSSVGWKKKNDDQE